MTTLKRRIVALAALAALASTGLAVGAATHNVAGSRWEDGSRWETTPVVVAGSRWETGSATTIAPAGSRWE